MNEFISMAEAMAEIERLKAENEWLSWSRDKLKARLEILQDAADNGVLVTRAETEQMDDVIHDALWGCK